MIKHFAGMTVSNRPLIMGIVNVTPDSFSDGGQHDHAEAAIAHGLQLWAEGADILDVGGESTRPGAAPVPLQEEINRVVPVIAGLKKAGARVSVDTRHTAVMQAALEVGVDVINDVTALSDQGALACVAQAQVPVILMHMQGQPQTMQENPHYEDVVGDIYTYLDNRIQVCEEAGLTRDLICVDMGIGFGKTLDHNRALLTQLDRFHGLDCAVLLGASRKSFIAHICGDTPPQDRLAGSLVAALKAADAGVQIVRVHDVADTKQALDVWAALNEQDLSIKLE